MAGANKDISRTYESLAALAASARQHRFCGLPLQDKGNGGHASSSLQLAFVHPLQSV